MSSVLMRFLAIKVVIVVFIASPWNLAAGVDLDKLQRALGLCVRHFRGRYGLSFSRLCLRKLLSHRIE
jgi:hypothetical protein